MPRPKARDKPTKTKTAPKKKPAALKRKTNACPGGNCYKTLPKSIKPRSRCYAGQCCSSSSCSSSCSCSDCTSSYDSDTYSSDEPCCRRSGKCCR